MKYRTWDTQFFGSSSGSSSWVITEAASLQEAAQMHADGSAEETPGEWTSCAADDCGHFAFAHSRNQEG